MDFISDIPLVNRVNAICNIVDRLSKKCHHITISKKINAERLANLFVHHVWKLHSLLRSIVLDRSTQFINDFWKFLYKRLGINLKLSIAWHLEIDGQTEQFNRVIE